MNFFGIELYLNDMDSLVKQILANVENSEKRAYYAINPDCLTIALNDHKYAQILVNKKNQVYVDGKGIIYTQKILGLPVAKERIATTDLFPKIIEMAEKKNKKIRIFLLGGRPGVAQKVIENIGKCKKYVQFVGEHHGYFEKEKSDEVIEIINESQADIVFVGFGCPIQEYWVNDNFQKLKSSVFITCGGLYDYYSNNVKRAPVWMQDIGLEWLFRLLQEPKRLYKRYIFGNVKYISKMLYIKIKGIEYYEKVLLKANDTMDISSIGENLL